MGFDETGLGSKLTNIISKIFYLIIEWFHQCRISILSISISMQKYNEI